MFIHFYGIDDASHLADYVDETFLSTMKAENILIHKLLNNIKESSVNND